MITLAVTHKMQDEMTSLLLDFSERHDLTLAELHYTVSVVLAERSFVLGTQEVRYGAATAQA